MESGSSKLLNYLSILTRDEKKRFPKWLDQELSGSDQKILTWLKLIYEKGAFVKAWNALPDDRPFDEKTIRRWNSRLLDWLERFLAIEAFKKDPQAQLLYLNRATLRRAQAVCYPDSIRKARKKLMKLDVRDHQYYQLQHELDRLDREFRLLYPAKTIRRYKPDKDAEKKHYSLFILLNQLEVILKELKPLEPLDPASYKFRHIDELGKFLQRESDKYPAAEFYYLLCEIIPNIQVLSEAQTDSLIHSYQQAFKCLRVDAQEVAFIMSAIASSDLQAP